MDNWTKLQLTELESVEDPGHGCTPLGLVHGDVEEVGGDGDQEKQHPHDHLRKALGSGLGQTNKSIEKNCFLSPRFYLECKGAASAKEVFHHRVDRLAVRGD